MFGVEYEPAAPKTKTANLPEVAGGGLYVIWFSDTHYYGGRAVSFRGRWKRHLRGLRRGNHGNAYMQAVFNKHGRFEPEVVTVCPPGEQESIEQAWLDEHYGKAGCLNLSRSSRNNASLSPASVAKRRETMRRRYGHLPKGHKLDLTDEERERRRKAVVVMQTPEAVEKMRRALTGRSLSHEHRQRLSERSARKGKPITDAIRAGIVAANKRRVGETRSQEVREKIATKVSSLVWVHKGSASERVSSSELEERLSSGWRRGRAKFSQKHRENLRAAQQGRVWVCNAEGATTPALPEDLPELLAKGWQRGRKYRPAK
jgi:hypothetical protein